MQKSLILGLSLISNSIFAFPCYLTLVKDTCWTNYTVSIRVYDGVSGKDIGQANLGPGKPWIRIPFQCEPKQSLKAQASFSPPIWENDPPKMYESKNTIFLPDTIKPDQSAWEVPICYPSAFAGIPLPPTADSNCKCDFSSIPAIAPGKAAGS